MYVGFDCLRLLLKTFKIIFSIEGTASGPHFKLSALYVEGTRTYKAFVAEAVRLCISVVETVIWPTVSEVLALALKKSLTISK